MSNEFNDRYDSLLGSINDGQSNIGQPGSDTVYTHLRLYKHEIDERNHVYARLVALFRALKAGQKQQQSMANLDLKWSTLASDIRIAAECLWLKHLLPYASVQEARQELLGASLWRKLWGAAQGEEPAEIAAIRQSVDKSRQLMLLWLEASLFRMRSSSNQVALQLELPKREKENPTRKAIKQEIFDTYLATLRVWDKELQSFTGRSFFQSGSSNAQQLKMLLIEFGPSRLSDYDEGWIAQAADAQAELRYQLREEVRREQWRNNRHISAAGLWLLKITTGYGTRPINFIRTVLIVIGVDAVAFFLNDLFNPSLSSATKGVFFCAETSPHIFFFFFQAEDGIRYVYLATTNITS